ncbi:hypothetical protein BGZ73_006186 [Actinomortierella ambigua]|nr:hypothetical protein BGZ73_006186 [Actinomortierella ambigua]
MSVASRLLRLTLFTKDNCGLCTNAKQALTRVQAKVPFNLEEVDIYAPGQEESQKYMFDVPVLTVKDGKVLMMHRIQEDKLVTMLQDEMKNKPSSS